MKNHTVKITIQLSVKEFEYKIEGLKDVKMPEIVGALEYIKHRLLETGHESQKDEEPHG